MKLYGSLQNRLEEGKMFCEQIEVGTGMTEYLYTDCHAYEVVEVIDQKHVIVREYDHKHVGESFTNDWELISNENNPRLALECRGGKWYWTNTLTADDLKKIGNDEGGMLMRLRLSLAGFDLEKVATKGKQTKRKKANVSFGKAEYYYDFSF